MTFLKTLVRLIGDGCIVFGIILTAFGVYGLAGGTGIPFYIGEMIGQSSGRRSNYLNRRHNIVAYRDSCHIHSP
jgi:hypothetical protein